MPDAAKLPTAPERGGVVCRTDDVDCDDLDLKLSQSWLRIAIASVFAGQGMVLSLALNMTPPPYSSTAYWVLHCGLILSSLVVLGFLGGPLFVSTLEMIRKRRLSIEGLFTLSLFGAFAGSLYGSFTGKGSVYYEIVAIVIAIYTFGRMVSIRSQEKVLLEVERVRLNLDQAVRISPEGRLERVNSSELGLGDRVRVEPGESFSVDGQILEGAGYVSETALTGEPVPVVRGEGDRVRAATHSVDGSFLVSVEAVRGDREIDRILKTVEDPDGKPSEYQDQANRLSQIFLPVVALVSLVTAVAWFFAAGWQAAFLNSMAVLLVACPCALGLATPVAIWHGLYRLSAQGIVSRDGALIDALAKTRRVFFDKTGTLSENELEVAAYHVLPEFKTDKSEFLRASFGIEKEVGHPVAKGIARYCEELGVDALEVQTRRIVPGRGVVVETSVGGEMRQFHLGSFDLDAGTVDRVRAEIASSGGKRVFLFKNEKLGAVFVLKERFRDSVGDLWEALEQRGVETEILTGDPEPDSSLPIPIGVSLHSGLSAEGKWDRVRRSVEQGEHPVFVGDGVNDSPSMAVAAASISLESGAALSKFRASAQILDERLSAIPPAIDSSREIRRRLKGNLVYAATYNVVGMTLAGAGLLHPVFAALLMLVSSFLVTARALK